MPAVSIQKAFELALQHHQAGRLAEAGALYRQILAAEPDHAGALHYLGVLAHQSGQHDFATQSIRRSILLQPNNPSAYSNLGEACRALGQQDEAIAAYWQALLLRPNYPDAHYNLGNALRDLGRMEEAAAAYRDAIQFRPDYPAAWNNLATILMAQRQFDEAAAACRRALASQPDFPQALNNLASALVELRQYDEAILTYRRALELQPDYAEALNNMGSALRAHGRPDEAIAAFQNALRLNPALPEAQDNLGDTLKSQGRLDEAIAAYRRSLEIEPGDPETYHKLGIIHTKLGQHNQAAAAYEKALHLKPDDAAILNNFGNALRRRGQFDQAMEAYRRAVQLNPDLAEAHTNLACAFKDQGQPGEAVAEFRHALRLEPENADLHSDLILTLSVTPGMTEAEMTGEQARWNRQFGEPLKPSILPHTNNRDPERRLRIGYVSADFRDHVVGRNALPLFRHHDHRNIEVVCYSGVERPDELTEQFRQQADEWRDTSGVEDAALAAMIRQDRIDLLVDLAQHTAGNRLLVFARQPAPVQVSFAGYPASTGLEAIEYRISDRYLQSPNFDLRTEQVLLVDSFWCYEPCGMEVEINALPAATSGQITFGSLNNFCKVNDSVLRLWARVLAEVKDSRLIMLSSFGGHRQRTVEFLERQGIAAHQVEFFEPRARREYLELYHRLDIVLDPFPYGGHTTSLDALWMGVPVVSQIGDTSVSRAGLSILTNLGLPELAAFSEMDYVRIAVELAGNLPRLAELRATLRPRMEVGVLMDGPHFARNIETAYRRTWRQWCAAR